jgi:uncharacterized protein YbjT (DUF2867 family)
MSNDRSSHLARPILVTGGTGTLGRLVVPQLRKAGCNIRVLSRDEHESRNSVEFVTGDLATGVGVGAAVAGTKIILHCAGSAKGDNTKALNLVKAASSAGVRHLVFISVVGADRIPVVSGIDRTMFGYFWFKHEAERTIADSGIPWTTLRATQFHDLTFMTVQGIAKMPVVPVPSGVRFQPVDTGEVAERLLELVLGKPAGLVPDLGGPRIYQMADLVRSYLQATGKRRPILPLRLPGKAAKAFRDGANLSPHRAVGRKTWEDFLKAQVRNGP